MRRVGREQGTKKTKKTRGDDVFDAIKKEGALAIISCLSKRWLHWKKEEKESCSTTFSYLGRVLDLHPTTLRKALEKLDDFGLIKKLGGRYSISDLGLFIHPFLVAVKTVSDAQIKRNSIPFDEKSDPMAWTSEAVHLIATVRPQGELLITTRWLSTFEKDKRACGATFEAARDRGVKIRIIGDLEFPIDLKNIFEKAYKAEIRVIPREKLEKPPKMLKPIFLDDFSHVMIADKTHWLYIDPHEKGELHSGKVTLNDPAIAGYLADVFESFWALSTPSH